jgi:hypothetical protein
MVFAEELAAIVIAVSLVLSTVLFGIEVFLKGRSPKGQGVGLVLSLLALPLYFIAFSDKFPGHPVGPRDLLLVLPGATRANIDFASSAVILILLVLSYALRLVIYTRLFIIPAFTMPEAEYLSRGQVERRANDLSAPVLAYLTLALVVTAIIVGIYALPAVAGAVIFVCLMLLRYVYPFLRRLRKSLLWLEVYIRILAREIWLLASRLVIGIVVIIVRLEKWRAQSLPEDELFFRRLEARLNQSAARARRSIEHERERLRHHV